MLLRACDEPRMCFPAVRRGNEHDVLVHDDPSRRSPWDNESTQATYGGYIFVTDVGLPFRESLVATINLLPEILTAMDVLCDEVKRGGVFRTDGVGKVLTLRRKLINAMSRS